MDSKYKRYYILMKQYMSGKKLLPDIFKYRFICYAIAAVHILITLRFFLLEYTILFIYNFISIFLYLYLGTFLAKKEHFFSIYIISFIEIISHSSVASILAGWQWGFMMYTIALIPVAFYLAYSLPNFKRGLLCPTLFSTGSAILYIITRFICEYIPPLYQEPASGYNCFHAHCFNSIVSFFMLIIFSSFFAMETRHNEICLQKQKQYLTQISSSDPLTNLLNRRSMDKHIIHAINMAKRQKTQFSIIIGDIDDFKIVNDTYGHNIGDEVLKNIAQLISNCITFPDVVCRWGGEEFLILLHNTTASSIPIVEDIREKIQQSEICTETTNIHITMTFGICEYIPEYTIQKLIATADSKLYIGKQNGKNQVVS